MTELNDNKPERLWLKQVAARLHMPAPLAWWRHRTGTFALPAGSEQGRPYWVEAELLRWAASTGDRRLIRLVPLRYWPTADQPADYWGTRQLDGCVAQMWGAQAGTICVLWRLAYKAYPSPIEIVERLPYADVLVLVQYDFGLDGPGLATAEPATQAGWREFGARWNDLARVLGQPAPYWPLSLRIPHLINQWKPGTPTVVYPTIPEIDTTPLLRLAATLPADTPAHQVLMNLVTITQRRSTNSAEGDLEILAECQQRPGGDLQRTTAVAARPLSIPEPDEDVLDDAVTRAGWMAILDRTDMLAAECVREASLWDGGRWFPYASLEQVDPTGEYGAEWAARLQPTERTAVFQRLGDVGGEPLTDPETGAPVVREADGTLVVAVPQRLPTASPLAEVVLDNPIWIRTKDGALHPAPRDSYFGLSWGYGGSGPGSLALLIHRLLDDITAPGADHASGAPEGLEGLTQLKWPRGTVLPRETLEAARDGRPYPKP